MNANNVLFTANRFNLSEVKNHFINPCCFGEDLAAWLRLKLREKGLKVSDPGQEDWGWFLQVAIEADSYFLGVSGNPDRPGVDAGKGRITVVKNRTVSQKLGGRGKIASDDPVTCLVEEILRTQQDFGNVHREL